MTVRYPIPNVDVTILYKNISVFLDSDQLGAKFRSLLQAHRKKGYKSKGLVDTPSSSTQRLQYI